MQRNEQLSAYMDGYEVDASFAQLLCDDPALHDKWESYHRIKDVMKGDECLLGADFSEKMAALLEDEVIEKQDTSPLAQNNAENSEKRGRLLSLKRWGMPLVQVGIAASVCLMAVVGFNTYNGGNEVASQLEQPALQTLPFSSAIQPVSYNAPSLSQQPTAEQLMYQQNRINALLQHYELQKRTNTMPATLSEEEKAKSQTSSAAPKENKR